MNHVFCPHNTLHGGAGPRLDSSPSSGSELSEKPVKPRRSQTFGALRRFNVLGRCVFPVVLSCRLIASPEAQDRASYRLGRALWKGLRWTLCNCSVRRLNVRFGSKADMCNAISHVRFNPNSDIDCVLIVFKPQHRPSFAGGFEPP